MDSNNFFQKIFKKKSLQSCKYLCSSLFFDYENNIKFCPYHNDFTFQRNFDGIWLDVDSLIKKREQFINDFKNGKFSNICSECSFIGTSTISEKKSIDYLILSNWKYCYLNCSYCKSPKEEDLVKANHYDVYNAFLQLIEFGVVTTKTKIIFESGDATVHPEFDKIMYYLINAGFENIVVNTPAMRYCESISEAISKNICEVVVSFDCGCPYIYERVKGYNKFDMATSNIKRYLGFQLPNEKRVVLKYTLVSGVNDNQKEILDWFMFARDIGIKKLAFDIDDNWFDKLKHSVPHYLKELLIFVRDMSVYNNIEIVFSDKIEILYKSIKEN